MVDLFLKIFPTAIYKSNLGRDLNDSESKFLNSQEIRTTDNKNYSKDSQILNKKEMVLIKNFVQIKLENYLQLVYSPKNKIEIYITDSWCNYNKKGHYHPAHSHANSFLSGTLLIDQLKEDSVVVWDNKIKRNLYIETNSYNEFTNEKVKINLKKGDIYIFPSDLVHSVPVNNEERTRLSLSFNSYIKGKISNEELSVLNI
jgi:uncharacterized protein (TIGR02466 family)